MHWIELQQPLSIYLFRCFKTVKNALQKGWADADGNRAKDLCVLFDQIAKLFFQHFGYLQKWKFVQYK